MPTTVTYGDADFTLTGSVKDERTGTGVWTWTSSDDTVLGITPSGATATVRILKAGSATITARYESDTTVGTEGTAVTVNKAAPTIKTVPAVTATYGQTLAEVPLYNPEGNDPGTWTWMDDDTEIDGVGEFIYKAEFMPEDSANYRAVSDIDVKVTDGKAPNPATVVYYVFVKNNGFSVDLEEYIIRNGATGKASFAFVDENDTKGCTLENSYLATGTSMGTVPIQVSIAEDDHYEAQTMRMIVSVSDKGKQTITADDVTTTYGATDAKVTATTDGGGAISYSVGAGSDVIGVDAKTGALTIKKAGKATVVVTAADTPTYMEASRRVTVTVKKAEAVAAAVTANDRDYDGTEKPLVTVTGEPTGGKMQYVLGTDATTAPTAGYTASIPTAVEAGTYYVWYRVRGDANHNDVAAKCATVRILAPISAKVTFKVVGGAWNDGTTGDKAVILTGKAGDALKLTADQIPAAGNKPAENYKAGSWDVTPSAETAITGDTTYTYTYEKESAPDVKPAAVVTKAPEANKPMYNGKRQKLVTEGTAEGGTMAYAATMKNKAPKASAYTEAIPEIKSAGAYYVWYKAVGDADHDDSETKKVKVIVYRRSIGDCKITVKDLSYTGKALKPKVTVKYGKTKLKEGKDYTLTYSKKLVNPGTWHVRVTGKGNFKSSEKLAFKVNMPAIESYKLTRDRTRIKVTWSQAATVRHCQIQVSRKKDFSSKKSVKFKINEKKEKHTKTVTGLQPGMKYYVRIRTYRTVGKKTYYSDWSLVKTVRTKSATQKNAQARPVEMAVGEVLDLNVLLTREEIEAVQTWSSGDAETAAVTPEGVVTAMQPGEAAVTAILEDDETIEFKITVREDGIVLLDIGEDDLTLDLDGDMFGDVIGDGMDVEANIEIEE